MAYKVKDVKVYRTLDFSGRDSSVITWTEAVPGVPDVSGFNVYRGDLDNFTKLNDLEITQAFYQDSESPIKPGAEWYYKVTYVSAASGESDYIEADTVNVHTAAPTGLYGRIYYTLMETVRRLNIGLNAFGEDIKIYIRKRYGPRCTCYDKLSGRSSDPNCEDCWGTGIMGGYDIYSGKAIITEQTARLPEFPEGVRWNYQPRGVIANYPIINDADGFRRQNGKLYLISEVSPVIMQNYMIEQQFTLSQMPEGHVLYMVE